MLPDPMTPDTTETIDALIARYVAGSLPTPARVLVESHLQLKPDNRGLAAGLEAMAGAAFDAGAPVALGAADQRIDAILAGSAAPDPVAGTVTAPGIFPPALRDFVGLDVEDVPWRTKMPGLKEYDIGEIDGCHVSLFWIRPGRKIPAHTHEGTELSLVLDGAFTDRSGRYGRGDISLADDTVDHRPTAEKDRPCIGLAVTDGPLRLTGPLHQRLSDILGV